MQNAKKTVKKILQPFYTAYHDYRYDKLYHIWLKKQADKASISAPKDSLQTRPLISVVVPTYNTDENFFREMVESVRVQSYDNWELVLVDDKSPNSRVRELVTEYAAKDKRVRYKFLDQNLGISGATNEAIKIASGDFVALFDHDDMLYPDTLQEVAMAINQGKYDFIYTDEDKINDKRGRHQPHCKPAWNSDLLRSVNYISHFTVIRKALLDKVGYEDSQYDGAQDWELFLRCTRALPDNKIHHIPKVLYSWRVHSGSTAQDLTTKPYVVAAQKLVLESDLRARGCDNVKVLADDLYPGQRYLKWTPKGTPKVSILLGSSLGDSVRKEIETKTTYLNYDIIPIEGGSDVGQLINKIDADFVLFVQSSLDIPHTDWLQDIVGDAQRPDIGFVQAKLKHPKEVAKNIESLLGPEEAKLINGQTSRNVTKHLYATTRYNLPAVEGGVTAVEASKLKRVLSDDTHLDIAKWSHDLHQQGFRNLYNPYIEVLE